MNPSYSHSCLCQDPKHVVSVPNNLQLTIRCIAEKKFTRELRKLSIQLSKITYIQIKVVTYLQRINFSVIQFYISKYRKLDELSLYKWQTILYKT